MSKSVAVKEVFGERQEIPKKRVRGLGSRAARGFAVKELEELGARALRLADMTTRRKKGSIEVPRLEALTELGHAALRLMAILERIKAQQRERERKEDEVACG